MSTSRARAGAMAVAGAMAIAAAVLLPHWFAATSPPSPSVSAPPLPSASAPPPPSAGAPIAPEITTLEGNDAFRLLVFSVPLASARLRVIDLPMSRDLATPLAESGASLVVNGGFFDKAQEPQGLVISEGTLLSPLSANLGGGVLTITQGKGALSPAEGFGSPPPGCSFAIQARPRLVVGGVSNISRDDGRAAERTALCLREGGSSLEVIVARGETPGQGPTLALLADMLVSRGCAEALNLDGGPSTGVAFRGPEGAEGRGARVLAPRGPVRQAIAIWAAPSVLH